MTTTFRLIEASAHDLAVLRSERTHVARALARKPGGACPPARSWWQDLGLMILSATILFSISLAPVAGNSLAEEPTWHGHPAHEMRVTGILPVETKLSAPAGRSESSD
jgi:hypothetical protein